MKAKRFVPQLESLESRLNPGKIVLLQNVVGPGLGQHILAQIASPQVNNDNAAGKVNFVSQRTMYANVGEIDMVFEVENSGGISEYWFETGVTNLTPRAWTAFDFQLGFGTGAGFVLAPALSGEGLDFDVPAYDPTPFQSVAIYQSLMHEHSWIQWYNGLMQLNAVNEFFLMIDVPDFDPAQMPPGARPRPDTGLRFARSL